MYQFVDSYDRAYEQAASSLGLSVAQVCVLIRLEAPRTMGSLASELDCDASNITQIVNRLEARGLVVRGSSPHDGRARLPRLTDQGRQAVAEFERAFTFPDLARSRLTADDLRTLTRLLEAAMGGGS